MTFDLIVGFLTVPTVGKLDFGSGDQISCLPPPLARKDDLLTMRRPGENANWNRYCYDYLDRQEAPAIVVSFAKDSILAVIELVLTLSAGRDH
mmetsp:Transcript_27055/g.33407  ORF Transcript_27055/g.33407 Transcript_27055/m.33407 type:complete len:93 (-) Transcript_27055:1220-1498(-)